MDLNTQDHTTFTKPHAERRVVLVYKNMPVAHHVSHIGLGVSSLNTAKVLRGQGVMCDVWPIMNAKGLAERIAATVPRPTHVIIGAPWLPTLDLQAYLVFRFPEIQFAVVCHSNVGFMQADPQAIKNFREDLDLEQGALNFTAGGNSNRFCEWITSAFSRPCTFLPNLYFMETDEPKHHPEWCGGTIRIGSFGAVRQLKNHITSAAAALTIADSLHAHVEFHFSLGRIEGGNVVVGAIRNMLLGLPNITLVEDEWYQWPAFRRLVRSMHLLMQPSHSESFNLVTADGASECVPSVVSDAIDWAPRDWKAEIDDTLSVASTGLQLLRNPRAGAEGFKALLDYNKAGVRAWRRWLNL